MASALQLERMSSSLFSTALFRPVLVGKSTARVDEIVSNLRVLLELQSASTRLTIVQEAYKVLQNTYRSEYYYRNLLTSKLFVGRHRASARSVLLNEMRIGSSVADCVFLNGEAQVFEIKTHLDRPEKLQGQVSNYLRAFSFVSVVVHQRDAQRYADLLSNPHIGVWAVGRRERLAVFQRASEDTRSLDQEVLLGVLRANEAAAALTAWHGPLAPVPNGRRHREHLALAREIPPVELRRLVHEQLRSRVFRGERTLMMSVELAPLRSVLLQLNPTPVQQARLGHWLSEGS